VTFSAHDAELALADAGIPFVRLLGGPAEPGAGLLLVGRSGSGPAGRVLEATGWRYRAGHRGRHRFAGHAAFTWDGGATVWLVRGIPAAPLPSRALAGLEERVWSRSRPAEDGVREPDPVDALLVAAVQVARPGLPRPAWRQQLVRLAGEQPDSARVAAAARDAGVAASLELALRRAGLPPAAGNPRGALRERLWTAGRLLQRAAGSRRLAALLDGAPIPGHAVFRTRFAGVEVESGRGVFLPVAFSEALLEAGLERIASRRDPVAIDVGTGCGAVALALARSRRDADVHAVDVSRPALRWARRNARRLGAGHVSFQRGSLLDPVARELRGRADLVLTNVPYAPPAYRRPSWHDMPGAVEGEDEDGLGLPRRLAAAARDVLTPGGSLVAQIALEQSDEFRSELRARGYVDDQVVAARAGDVVVAARAGR
jgi:release factor glutamine methyltransferase